ncbi:unnamed protein product [Amoebophrya sp. A25]|nr:unnamed protein product [Amoebophrya sp. A25]|eukprot:GSA25T00020611001.1
MRPDSMLLEINFEQRCHGLKPYMWQTLDAYAERQDSDNRIHFQISGNDGSQVFDKVFLKREMLGYPRRVCNETGSGGNTHRSPGYYADFARGVGVYYDSLELQVDVEQILEAERRHQEKMRQPGSSEEAPRLVVGKPPEEGVVNERSTPVQSFDYDPQGRLKYADFFLPIAPLDAKVGAFLKKKVLLGSSTS